MTSATFVATRVSGGTIMREITSTSATTVQNQAALEGVMAFFASYRFTPEYLAGLLGVRKSTVKGWASGSLKGFHADEYEAVLLIREAIQVLDTRFRITKGVPPVATVYHVFNCRRGPLTGLTMADMVRGRRTPGMLKELSITTQLTLDGIGMYACA